jgi:hypothetical protein
MNISEIFINKLNLRLYNFSLNINDAYWPCKYNIIYKNSNQFKLEIKNPKSKAHSSWRNFYF